MNQYELAIERKRTHVVSDSKTLRDEKTDRPYTVKNRHYALEVSCPVCEAAATHPCKDRGGDAYPRTRVHVRRERACVYGG
jgi:hypothetical protein